MDLLHLRLYEATDSCYKRDMPTSGILEDGEDQVVLIPHGLEFDPEVAEVEIERCGDTLYIRPIDPNSPPPAA